MTGSRNIAQQRAKARQTACILGAVVAVIFGAFMLTGIVGR